MKLSLEGSQALQTTLTDHIRNPERNAAPVGIEDRRLAIYRRLFYNNVEGFMRRGFPIAHKILDDRAWHALMREFLHEHRSTSPFFTEVTQEFVSFLQGREPVSGEPAFLLELCHYEWVEIALDLADTDLNDYEQEHRCDKQGDLLGNKPLVSPLAWSLQYQYPVHLIGVDEQPQSVPAEPTLLVVYRNRMDEVKFMAVNQLTVRMLALLEQTDCEGGLGVLEQLAQEMGAKDPKPVIEGGRITLEKLRELDIILGTSTVAAV